MRFHGSLNVLRLCSTPVNVEYFVNSGVANVFILRRHSAGCIRNVDEGRRRGAKRFMKLPLKVNMGFELHLWRCGDLCLISFRCWLALGFGLEGGVLSLSHTHIHTPCSRPIFAVSLYQRFSLPCVRRNRATFVPTSRMVSCGRSLRQYDNTRPVRGEQRQMEKLIFD